MYVVRGENGIIFTSCLDDETNGQEETHATLEEAEQHKELMQPMFNDVTLYVEKINNWHTNERYSLGLL